MRPVLRLLLVLGLWASGLVCPAPAQGSEVLEVVADVEVFVRAGCPACKAAKVFLEGLQHEYPAVRIVFRDVDEDPSALPRLAALAARHGVSVLGVPAFDVRGEW